MPPLCLLAGAGLAALDPGARLALLLAGAQYVSALAMGGLLAFAILVPSLPLSIAGFALAGVASGPVFPMIVAVGGERYPERSAAVGGSLTGMAVVGSIVYPPAMGFLSVAIGLVAAMLGTVVLAFLCAAALVAFGRSSRRAH